MARVGLTHLVAAPKQSGKYGTGFLHPGIVDIDITPVYEDDSEYTEMNDLEDCQTLSYAEVTLELSGEEETLLNQSPLGLGFCTRLQNRGQKVYCAIWLHKVQLYEKRENYHTRDDSISYGTVTLEGKATKDTSGEWRTKKKFTTQKEAYEWLNKQANL